MKYKKIINNMINKIESGASGEISIKDLSEAVGVSPWYLQKIFKQCVGETIGNYIRTRNLNNSAKMLKETNLGILDIALDSGYSSHEAFTRSFKCFFGMTPKEFRNNNRAIM